MVLSELIITACLVFILLGGFQVLLFPAERMWRSFDPSLSVRESIVVSNCSLLLLVHLADFFGAPVKETLLVIVLGLLILWGKGRRLPEREFLSAVAASLLCGGVLYAFIVIALPAGAIFSGHFVCNDTVHHAFMGQGYSVTRGTKLDPQFWTILHFYPRAFHSVLWFLSGILHRDPIFLITPVLCAFCALLQLVAFPGYRSPPLLLVAGFAALATPLSMLGIGLSFASQMAVAPILYLALHRTITLGRAGFILWPTPAHLSLLILFAAALALYGPFTALVGVIALLLYLYSGWRGGGQGGRLLSYREFLWSLGGLAIILIPPAWNTFTFVIDQIEGGTGTALATDKGNLRGYLSFLHLSGFWDPAVDYRFPIETPWIWWTLAVIAAVKILFSLIFSDRTTRELTVGVLALTFLSALLFGSYASFKILAFACVVTGAAFVGALTPLFRRELFVFLALLLPAAVGGWNGLKVQFTSSNFYLSDWREIEEVRDRVMAKGETLVVSREDWLSYAATKHRAYVPQAMYLHRSVRDAKLLYVVFDRHYEKEWVAYQPRYTRTLVHAERENLGCVKEVSTRFRLLDLQCAERAERVNKARRNRRPSTSRESLE